jgi:PAS domain S-box-containing protein
MAYKSLKRGRLSHLLFLIYLVLAAGIFGAGYLYFRNYGKMIFLAGALLLGVVVGWIWRQQRLRFYRAQAQSAETLRETNEYLESLFNYANAPIIVWGPQFKITRFNRAFESLTGRKAGDVIGQSLEILFPPDRANDSMKLIRKMLRGERWETVEIAIRHLDGSVRTLLWNSANILGRDGKTPIATIAQGHDITERKRAEEALVLQKRIADVFLTVSDDERFNEILFNEILKIILEVMQSPHGAFGYIDAAGAWVVPSLTRHIWDKCQIPDKTITFPRDTWGDSSWPRAIKEKKTNYSNEESANIPEGHIAIRRHISLPILFRGEVIGLFQVANKETDYTEADVRALETIAGYVAPILSSRLHRQRHEEELRKRNEELTRFIYAVSHDLKSPLVTINTFLGFLEHDARKPDAAAVDKDLGYIRAACAKMSRLLDELLELTRVGHVMNPSVEVTLQEVVKEALSLVAGRIAAGGVKVKVTGKPILLCGDRPRLVEAFQNLVDNAVKFMGGQPAPSVEIGVEQADTETVLFVRDNGIGIDARYLPKLFGLFEKLDPGTEGTGIGLALVKRIVEVHGGRIWAESAGPGQGTTFRFTLAKARRQFS